MLEKAVISDLDIEDYWENTSLAIERAEELDVAPSERWPNDLGSRIYLLMKKIMVSIQLVDS
jgi:hypothetical protein